MRHRKAGVKLNRSSSHRKAMFRNMVTSLFKHDRIKTTDTRAKEVSRWADHIITLAKRGDLHARRQAMAIVREKDVVHKIFEEANARFGKRSGGYTRVVKLGRRPGDAALISMIELIAEEDQPKKKKKKKTKAAAKKAAPAKQDAAAKTAASAKEQGAAEAEAQPAADEDAADAPAADQERADEEQKKDAAAGAGPPAQDESEPAPDADETVDADGTDKKTD